MADNYTPRFVPRKGKGNHRTPRAEHRPPETMVSVFERNVTNAKENIVATRKLIEQTVGPRPFGTQKIPQREQARRYLLIRDDPNAWVALIQQHGLKDVVDYSLRMEHLLGRYPEEQDTYA